VPQQPHVAVPNIRVSVRRRTECVIRLGVLLGRCGDSNTGRLSALNQKDKGSKLGNLPESNALFEIRENWIAKILSLLRRTGFSPSSVRVGFVVHKVAQRQVFLQYLSFPLSVSFHQCCILIFRYMLLLPEGDSLRVGQSGDRIPVRTRFSAPVQTGPRDHPASYTMGSASFPGIKQPERGVNHPPHLALRLKKE
jgi:hypothetical protein